MTTPREIIEGAYGYSVENQPEDIATESTELRNLVVRAVRGLYAYSARINPTFFADIETVSHDGSNGWPRPSGAESVFYMTLSDGTAVAVVPYDDQDAEPESPCVYRVGQIYRRASGDTELSGTPDIDFYFTIRPSDPADLDADLDDSWTEQFDELLMLEVALYLALKDGRSDELQTLLPERNEWLNRFTAFLEHETANERRRWGHVRNIYTESQVPAVSLLAAGGEEA